MNEHNAPDAGGVDAPLTRSDIWRQAPDHSEIWDRFNHRFEFRADFYERSRPAIRLDPGCLVIDLASIFSRPPSGFAADGAVIEETALRAFADLAGDDELVAIDWHHPSYRYSPRAQLDSDADLAIPVFPDGDYYGHMTADLAWGPSATPGSRPSSSGETNSSPRSAPNCSPGSRNTAKAAPERAPFARLS